MRHSWPSARSCSWLLLQFGIATRAFLVERCVRIVERHIGVPPPCFDPACSRDAAVRASPGPGEAIHSVCGDKHRKGVPEGACLGATGCRSGIEKGAVDGDRSALRVHDDDRDRRGLVQGQAAQLGGGLHRGPDAIVSPNFMSLHGQADRQSNTFQGSAEVRYAYVARRVEKASGELVEEGEGHLVPEAGRDPERSQGAAPGGRHGRRCCFVQHGQAEWAKSQAEIPAPRRGAQPL